MTESSDSFGFGDTVRIRQSADTVLAGIAGLEGTIYGFTTPSASGVTAVGALADDFAWNVHIDSLGTGFWLDPSNIELVAHPETMELTVAGKTIRVTRTEDGYKEEIVASRPWWKLW